MSNEKVIGNYAYLLQHGTQIGSGQFSNVYKGYNTKSKAKVAIKQIDKRSLKGMFETMLRNEIKVMSLSKHKCIIKMHDYYETPNNVYIITDYCNTDLLQLIKKSCVPEVEAKNYLLQLVEAVQHLHEQKIIHRDLKPPNVLIQNGQVKLADFGFAMTEDHRKAQKDTLANFQVGSPLYMSPESMLHNQYDYQTDIWSLGILFYEMLFGTVPFFSVDLQDLKNQLSQYKISNTFAIPKRISQLSIQILRNLLAYNPKNRCSLLKLRAMLTPAKINKVSQNHNAGANPKQPRHCTNEPPEEQKQVEFVDLPISQCLLPSETNNEEIAQEFIRMVTMGITDEMSAEDKNILILLQLATYRKIGTQQDILMQLEKCVIDPSVEMNYGSELFRKALDILEKGESWEYLQQYYTNNVQVQSKQVSLYES